jgi:hypothetical protein
MALAGPLMENATRRMGFRGLVSLSGMSSIPGGSFDLQITLDKRSDKIPKFVNCTVPDRNLHTPMMFLTFNIQRNYLDLDFF